MLCRAFKTVGAGRLPSNCIPVFLFLLRDAYTSFSLYNLRLRDLKHQSCWELEICVRLVTYDFTAVRHSIKARVMSQLLSIPAFRLHTRNTYLYAGRIPG